jgi:hypothetical protein
VDGRTERARGQVIVIFALALLALMLVAALAFDTGMVVLERRDQQNAADAAALAGARYLVGTPPTTPDDAARAVATANGFTNGVNSMIVDVFVPPATGQFRGFDGFIEVAISNRRPSIIAGVAGIRDWRVASRAVAANQPGLDLPFSMLTLHPSKCGALQVTGSGNVLSAGTIQVNSTCNPNALDVGGLGSLTVTADGAVCNAVGYIERRGANSTLNCTQVEDSYAITDPLKNLVEPPVPTYPAWIQQVSGAPKNRPVGCPGSSNPATATVPRTCLFGGSYDGTTWRLFPGYYPGGIDLGKGTFLLEPGIYYIGGGGFRAANGNVQSVQAGTATFGGGALIFNTEAYEFSAGCASGSAPAPAVQCLAPIVLNGGSSGVNLKPLADGSLWDGLVIYQDRHLNYSRTDPTQTDVQINGGGSVMEVAGTIYVPVGDVVTNGSTGTLILDQVIAYTYKINGNGGTIDVRYQNGVTARVSGVGLVE